MSRCIRMYRLHSAPPLRAGPSKTSRLLYDCRNLGIEVGPNFFPERILSSTYLFVIYLAIFDEQDSRNTGDTVVDRQPRVLIYVYFTTFTLPA